jgi:hypothetical protein
VALLDGFVHANLRATDGGTLTVERHEGPTA